MKRQITPENSPECQALIDHKEATLQVILSKIPDTNSTFHQIAEIIGVSYEYVRVRLMQHPERLYKFGTRYKVPNGVAKDFVRSVFV